MRTANRNVWHNRRTPRFKTIPLAHSERSGRISGTPDPGGRKRCKRRFQTNPSRLTTLLVGRGQSRPICNNMATHVFGMGRGARAMGNVR